MKRLAIGKSFAIQLVVRLRNSLVTSKKHAVVDFTGSLEQYPVEFRLSFYVSQCFPLNFFISTQKIEKS